MFYPTIAVITTLTIFAGDTAPAQDILILGGGKIELSFPADGPTQDLSVYAEMERAGLYAGILGLASNDRAATMIQLYAGYRAETDTGFTYDLSYTRFFYPNDGGDFCGELALSFGQPIGRRVTALAELTYDPAASSGGIEIGAEVKATETLTVSTNIALAQQADGTAEKSWDFGMGYDLNHDTNLDLRYHDGVDVDGYLGITVSFETNLLGG